MDFSLLQGMPPHKWIQTLKMNIFIEKEFQ